MSDHAISNAHYNKMMLGFRHGAGGQPMLCEDSYFYSLGYADGQNARRAYSRRICKRMGLVDSVVKPLWCSRGGKG